MMRDPAFWKKAPFVRLLLPLVTGIIIQYYLKFGIQLIGWSALVVLILYTAFRFLPSFRFSGLLLLKGIFISLFILCLGSLICWMKTDTNHSNWYGNVHTNNVLQLILKEAPVKKTNSWQAEADIKAVENNNNVFVPVSGRIILYFSKEAGADSLSAGDVLITTADWQPIKNAGNPGSFNNRQYAAFHHWFHTIYLQPGKFFKSGHVTVGLFRQMANRSRSYVIHVLETHLHADPDVSAIAKALIIGYKTDLDKNLVQAYSNTGIVHIIAISGMHLGIFYLMLEFLFNLLPFAKNSKKKIIPIILLLWGFALLTGGSASVLRSALMFSFMLIGKNYFKQTSSYNSLAVSAFILLCYNPFFLWDVGFQMSYLAVTGIVWLQKPIFHLLYIRNKPLKKLWELSSVSLAAQLVTFPLSVFYFHQFPVLFLFVNLLAIPCATVALCSGIALVVFSAVPGLSQLCAWVLFHTLEFLNKIVNFFNNLSFNTWDGLYATLLTTFSLYILLFTGILFLQSKNKTFLYSSLVAFALLIGLYSTALLEKMHQSKIIIYNAAKFTAIDVIEQGSFKFIGDTIFQNDDVLRNFHLKSSRISSQATKEVDKFSNLIEKGNLVYYKNISMFIADSVFRPMPLAEPAPINVLLLTKRSFSLDVYLKTFRPAIVICNGSNSLWKTAEYKKQCVALHLSFFDTATEGAYVLEVK